MKTIFIVIFALLIFSVGILFIWKLLWGLPASNEKKIFIAITIIGILLFETLLFFVSSIPRKADNLLSTGIATIESKINEISPEYSDEVLNPEKIKSLIADTKQIRFYLNENAEVNFVVRMIGLNTYVSLLEKIGDNTESYLKEFESKNIPFTLHNIFDFLQQESRTSILKIVKIIEMVVVIVALVFYLILLIGYFANRKNLLTPNSSSVTFGE